MLRLFLGFIYIFSSELCRLYVSPAGDDLSGNGKEDNPWQSLEKAQSAVRELIAEKEKGVILTPWPLELPGTHVPDARRTAEYGGVDRVGL
jgi:hypothetical protein